MEDAHCWRRMVYDKQAKQVKEVHVKDSYYYESVTDAIPCGGYKVAVRFRKGECGVFDCTPYLDDSFWASLRDKSVFDKVRVDCGMLTWPGDIDIAPEEVWADAVRTTEKCIV